MSRSAERRLCARKEEHGQRFYSHSRFWRSAGAAHGAQTARRALFLRDRALRDAGGGAGRARPKGAVAGRRHGRPGRAGRAARTRRVLPGPAGAGHGLRRAADGADAGRTAAGHAAHRPLGADLLRRLAAVRGAGRIGALFLPRGLSGTAGGLWRHRLFRGRPRARLCLRGKEALRPAVLRRGQRP